MSESFVACHHQLINLISGTPSMEEMEALLRITPQGIAKINTDFARGIKPSVTMAELTQAYIDHKNLKTDFTGLDLEMKLSAEEALAMEWVLENNFDADILEDKNETVMNIVWEFRKYSLLLESYKLRSDGHNVSVTSLTPTKYLYSKEYVDIKRTSSHYVLSLNPVYLWFDDYVILNSSHYNLFQNPPKKCNYNLLRSEESINFFASSSDPPKFNLCAPSNSTRFRRVRFEDSSSTPTEGSPTSTTSPLSDSSRDSVDIDHELHNIPKLGPTRRSRLNSFFNRLKGLSHNTRSKSLRNSPAFSRV